MKPAVIAAVAVAAMGGTVAWRALRPHGKSAAPHVAVLFDRSASATAGCPAVVGIVSQELAEGRLTPDSSVTVTATGDAETSGEPTEIFRDVPARPGRAIGGRRSVRKNQDASIARLSEKCRDLPTAATSPIALGIRGGLEALRSRGCGPESGCRVQVVSDGEETVETWIARSISGRRADPTARPRLDNAGIAVAFCGISETKGPSDRTRARRRVRDVRRADRLRHAWRSVFTAPELVRFEPHCPGGQFPAATDAKP